ncbi:sugar-binding protein [Haliangium sp.]|uniref:sugar-binding protein n=1 Tax=Haliangium sp. TaxID=2663208 RepID=UPI003D0CB8BA
MPAVHAPRPSLARLSMTICWLVAATGCQFNEAGVGGGPTEPADAAPVTDASVVVADASANTDAAAAPEVDAAVDASPDAAVDDGPVLIATMVASTAITVDGDADEWSDEHWLTLQAPDDYVLDQGPGDDTAAALAIRFAARWHPSLGLYLAFEVRDDAHANDTATSDVLWQGDSVQVGFDVADNDGTSYDTSDDFEYGWALVQGAQVHHRWFAPDASPIAGDEFAVVRDGDTTTYEVRLPPTSLGLGTLTVGQRSGFSVIVNDDDDGTGRDGWLEWTPGIGAGKNPGSFGALVLE